MIYQYQVDELFIYNGNYEYLHGEVGQVVTIKHGYEGYGCILLTEKEVPFINFRLTPNKMLPYNREPDWEI